MLTLIIDAKPLHNNQFILIEEALADDHTLGLGSWKA